MGKFSLIILNSVCPPVRVPQPVRGPQSVHQLRELEPQDPTGWRWLGRSCVKSPFSKWYLAFLSAVVTHINRPVTYSLLYFKAIKNEDPSYLQDGQGKSSFTSKLFPLRQDNQFAWIG